MSDRHPTETTAAGRPVGFAYDGPDGGGRATAAEFLLDALRRRGAGRMLVSGLTVLLFLAGAGMFAYPFVTDVYTEQIVQERLEDEFRAYEVEVESPEDWEQTVRGEQGAALTRIALPTIDVETLVVEGTSADALRAGAGHYPNTPLPGQVGNVAVAGHRTTYGRPFNRLDELRVGDEIWLATPFADHRYEVVAPPDDWQRGRRVTSQDGEVLGPYITDPRDWSVIQPTSSAVLTLTTCHPKGSAAERLIVRAELVESLPPGAYRQQQGGPRAAA